MSASIPSVVQLQRAIKIAEKIQQLEAELASILGESHAVAKSIAAEAPRSTGIRSGARRPYTFSAATLAKRAAAQGQPQDKAAPAKPKKKFKMSAAGRAAIVAAQKARWAKQKGQA